MNAVNRKAVADVTRRVGWTVLMILGILLGVLGMTAVNQANDQISGAFFYSTDPSAVPNITMTVNQLPASVAATIEHLPGVQKVQFRTFYGASWHVAGQAEAYNLQVFAYPDVQRIQLWPFQITAGRMSGPGEIVLDSRNVLEGYPATLGSTIALTTPAGHTVSLRVVGLSRTQGFALGNLAGLAANAIGYMSPAGLQQLVGQETYQAGGGYLSQQILLRTPDSKVVQTYNTLKQIFAQAQITVSPKSTWSYASGWEASQLSVIGPLRVIQMLSLLALLLVCSLIFSAVTTLLAEQMKIIGTMKALGGTRWRIARSYLLTVAIYSSIGTVLGLELGLVAGYQLASSLASTIQLNLGAATVSLGAGPFQVSPWVPITSVLVGLLVPALSALWPLWAGTRITVREAIAAYGVYAAGGKTRPPKHAWGRSLQWVPQTVWLGLRSLFRKPGRTSFTLIALALAGALFLAVQMAQTSLGLAVAQQYSPIVNPDVRVDLGDHAQAVVAGIQHLPNVASVVPVAFGDGLVGERRLFLTGVPADQYRPDLVAGRWLRPHEQGSIVLNEVTATRLHLQIGQTISIQMGLRGPQARIVNVEWQIVGLFHATDYLSGSEDATGTLGEAFVTMDLLNATLGQPADYADRVIVHARDRSPQALLLLKQQIQQLLSRLGETQAQARTLQELMQGEVDPLPTIYTLFYAVAILVALIGLLSLALTLATSVLERRLEIGILRSLGATGWRVGTVFWIEGLALGLLAWALGLLFGLPGGLLVVQVLGTFLGPLEVSLSPWPLLSTLGFVLVVAGLASFGPTLVAARMRIQRVLRYE